MNDIKQLFFNYLALLTGNVGRAGLEFISIALLARVLGAEKYGVYNLFLMVTQIIFVLGVNWTLNSMIRYGKEEYTLTESVRKTFWGGIVIVFFLGLLSILGMHLWRSEITGYIGLNEKAIVFVIVFTIASSLYRVIPTYLQATEKIKYFAFLPLLSNIATLIALSLMWLGLIQRDVLFVFAFLALSYLLIAGAAFWIIRQSVFPITLSKPWIKKMLSFSWPMILGGISSYVVSWIDMAIIKLFLTTSLVGVYSAAYRIEELLAMMPTMSISLMFPIMTSLYVSQKGDLIRRYSERNIPQLVFGWSLAMCVVIIISKPGLGFILGDQYRDAALPMAILALALVFRSVSSCYSPILTVHERMIKILVASSIFMSVVNVLLDYTLIPRYGIAAAAAATTTAFAIEALFRTYLVSQVLHLGNFKAVLCSLPAFLCLVVYLLPGKEMFPRLFIALSILIASLWVAKRGELFKREDLEMLEPIEMPSLLKTMIARAIYALST